MPGETWNANNVEGMGKVWFTVSVSLWDQRTVLRARGHTQFRCATHPRLPFFLTPSLRLSRL